MQDNKDAVYYYRDEKSNLKSNIPHCIVRHSPDGFEVGYRGSGPAEFALNILIHFYADMSELADENFPHSTFIDAVYQIFKEDFLVNVNKESGVIPGSDIRKWITEKHKEFKDGL
jgi:hypothetical protein